MTRTDLLNFIIDKYDFKSYCELGTQVRSINFDKIKCDDKFCVDIDPNAKADFTGSTDDFFKQLDRKYDLYFIDASHVFEDVERDYVNAIKNLSPGGMICLHDCNPEKEEYTIVPRPTPRGHYNGNVYKLACNIWFEVKCTVDIDNGCMVVRPHASKVMFFTKDTSSITWRKFNENRKELLNLISWDEFTKM